MAQAATSASTVHALYIDQSSLASPGKGFETEFIILAEASNFLKRKGTFHYNERARISFHLTPEYRQYFALVKGLIEFHRSPNLAFTYDRAENSFDIDFPITASGQAQAFLEWIYQLLKSEVAFKTALKGVMQFEEEYKKKKELVYRSIITPR